MDWIHTYKVDKAVGKIKDLADELGVKVEYRPFKDYGCTGSVGCHYRPIKESPLQYGATQANIADKVDNILEYIEYQHARDGWDQFFIYTDQVA